MVDGEVEVVERDVVKRFVERALGQRQRIFPERPAAADGVFPETRLALVHAERDGLAHRRAVVRRVEALFVEAVADFMQDAEERVAKLVRLVARGEPAVARPDAGAERMGRGVEPPALEVEADGRGHRLAEYFLALDRITPAQDRNIRLA